MSVNREAVACYRLYAANCVELAENIQDLDRRVFLLAMARDWLRLAEQVEKESEVGQDPAASDSNCQQQQSPDRAAYSK